MSRLLNGYPRRADGSLGYRRVPPPALPLLLTPSKGYGVGADHDYAPAPEGSYKGQEYQAPDSDSYLKEEMRRWESEKKKKQALQRKLRADLQAAARNSARKLLADIAKAAMKKMNGIGIAIDVAEAIYGEIVDYHQEVATQAERMATFWRGQAAWTKNLDCAPASGNVSPYHYPQLSGSSCLTLWSNPVTERNLYALQVISGQTYRVMRLMEQAQLNIECPGCVDRGRTFEQYLMLESTFQTDPNLYRRQGSQYSRSKPQTGNPWAPAIHPGLMPILQPTPIPRPLIPEGSTPGQRPGLNEWPEGHQGGYQAPATPGLGSEPTVRPGVGTTPSPVPGTGFVPLPGPGPAVPGPIGPSIPSVNTVFPFAPGASPEQVNGRHDLRPPGNNEQQGKGFSRALSLLIKGFAAGTEALDLYGAVKKSVPASVRKKCKQNVACYGEWIWNNWDAELATRILGNVVYNAIEDAVVGRAIGKAQNVGKPYQNPFTGARRVASTSIGSGVAKEAAFDFFAGQPKESP